MTPPSQTVCAEIRHGTKAHADTLALRDEVLRRPLGLAFSPDELAQEADSFHLGCWRAETLVACLVLKPLDGKRVRMRQLAVRDAFQGQGIGRALVTYAEAFAGDHGYEEIILHARESAVPFYKKAGYDVIGDRFIEVTIPHVAMRKRIANFP